MNRTHTNKEALKKLDKIDNENFSILKDMHVVDHLVENNQFTEVVCVGAGPSLDAEMEKIKALAFKKIAHCLLHPPQD